MVTAKLQLRGFDARPDINLQVHLARIGEISLF
jgi:hypothetical protein